MGMKYVSLTITPRGARAGELHDRARIINVTPPVIRQVFERPSSASKVTYSCNSCFGKR